MNFRFRPDSSVSGIAIRNGDRRPVGYVFVVEMQVFRYLSPASLCYAVKYRNGMMLLAEVTIR